MAKKGGDTKTDDKKPIISEVLFPGGIKFLDAVGKRKY